MKQPRRDAPLPLGCNDTLLSACNCSVSLPLALRCGGSLLLPFHQLLPQVTDSRGPHSCVPAGPFPSAGGGGGGHITSTSGLIRVCYLPLVDTCGNPCYAFQTVKFQVSPFLERSRTVREQVFLKSKDCRRKPSQRGSSASMPLAAVPRDPRCPLQRGRPRCMPPPGGRQRPGARPPTAPPPATGHFRRPPPPPDGRKQLVPPRKEGSGARVGAWLAGREPGGGAWRGAQALLRPPLRGPRRRQRRRGRCPGERWRRPGGELRCMEVGGGGASAPLVRVLRWGALGGTRIARARGLETASAPGLTSRCLPAATLGRRTAPLGPMPNEDIDVTNLERLEKYRSFDRYRRRAEQEARKPHWWRTYREHFVEESGPERAL